MGIAPLIGEELPLPPAGRTRRGTLPRTVVITVSSNESEKLVQQLSALPGIIGVRLQPGGGRNPHGDVITLDITNRGLSELTRLLARASVGSTPHSSFSTSEPLSIVSAEWALAITDDSSEATWEEMDVAIGKNSNMTVNGLVLMGSAGVLATLGIATNALHIVLGAMLIAPGFQPIVRIALGVVGKSRSWRYGALHTLKGYLALAAGAAATALFLQTIGKSAISGEASYLPAGTLISYWTTITIPSVVIALVGGGVGAILLATNRAVLTAGVMVALALVPGAAIAGLGAASGDFNVAAAGVLRWAVEASLVLTAAFVVLGWKKRSQHRRPMLL